MDASCFIERRKKIADTMVDDAVLLLFSGSGIRQSADSFYPFYINRNFYYMTGIDRCDCVLQIVKSSCGVWEKLFIISPEIMNHAANDFPLQEEEAAKVSGVVEIGCTSDFKGQLHKLFYGNQRNSHPGTLITTVYGDLERQSIEDEPNKSAEFIGSLKSKYPHLTICDVYHTIANWRLIKSQPELTEIRRAIELTAQGIKAILREAAPSGNECELEAVFMHNAICGGEKVCGFPPITACGENALLGHYSANNRPLVAGELVLLDLGCNSNYYSADVSRAFPVSGVFSPDQLRLYQAVLSAHKKILADLGPGQFWSDNRKKNTELITEELRRAGYSTKTDPKFSCFGGVDHYLGLDTHDVGAYDLPFAPGMVLTVDSSVTLPDSNIAFRLEDDILITTCGCEVLSSSIPVEAEEIQAMMAEGNYNETVTDPTALN